MSRWCEIAFLVVALGALTGLSAVVAVWEFPRMPWVAAGALVVGLTPVVVLLSLVGLAGFHLVLEWAKGPGEPSPTLVASCRSAPFEGPTRCPFCLADVQPREARVSCQRCRAPQHSECWNEAAGTCSACRGSTAFLSWADLLRGTVERDRVGAES